MDNIYNDDGNLIYSSRKRLGQILLEIGVINEEQLEHALEVQKDTKRLLGQVFVSLGYCSPETIITALDMQGVSIFEQKISKYDNS